MGKPSAHAPYWSYFCIVFFVLGYIIVSWYLLKDPVKVFLYLLLVFIIVLLYYELVIKPFINDCIGKFEEIVYELFSLLELRCLYLNDILSKIVEFIEIYPIESALAGALIVLSIWLFMLCLNFLEEQYYRYKDKNK